ncbi:hypothetical protein N566_13060 [Streptomycetaceae bacterium MP113-05]|nr:hypothetical protein N566_13060 [Streptomycetaceae bacterium MP113-05]
MSDRAALPVVMEVAAAADDDFAGCQAQTSAQREQRECVGALLAAEPFRPEPQPGRFGALTPFSIAVATMRAACPEPTLTSSPDLHRHRNYNCRVSAFRSAWSTARRHRVLVAIQSSR